MKSKIEEFYKSYYPILLIAFVTLVSVEWLNHNAVFVSWLLTHLIQFTMNYLLYVSIFFLLLHLLRKITITTFFFTVLFVGLAVINYYKIIFKGEPFMIWDILNASAAMGVASDLTFPITFNVIFIVLLTITTNVIVFVNRKKIQIPIKMKSFITSLVTLTLIFTSVIIPNKVFSQYNYKPSENYFENGFAPGLMVDIYNSRVSVPNDYSKETIEALYKKYSNKQSGDLDTKPNVIVIMNEAFSDLSDIRPDIEFTEDPLKNYHNNSDLITGKMLTSIYGGYTANTEFEFLTNHSMAFLPNGSVAYQHYINESNCQSIVPTFKQSGYKAVAIHPYDPTFWRRDEVYSCFGFDTFLSIEDFDSPITNEFFIKDVSVKDKIIETFEANDTNNPIFTFAVTMENHVPHTSNRNPHIFTTTPMEEELANNVASYVSNVSHGDQMFQDLVDYFKQKDEPVIIVMFGDHQPSFSTQLNPDYELTKNYLVPYMVYTNLEVNTHFTDLIAPSILSANVMEMTGLDLSFYTNFSLEIEKYFNAYNPFSFFNEKGELIVDFEELSPKQKEIYHEHQLFEYDLLFGKQYLLELINQSK